MAKTVTKYYGIAKKKKIANMIISITAMLSIIIVLVTIYGQNVGNFVIGVESNVRVSLSLSEDRDFRSPSSRLTAPGLREQTHATLSDIPEDIDTGDGEKNDDEKKRYFAYSFYVKNSSSVILDYDVEIVLKKSTKGSESAIRVMVIKNDISNIYAMPKEYPEDQIGKPEDHVGTGIEVPYITTPFASLTTIMQQRQRNFEKEAVNKYTVVMWLEGWDRECVDEIKGGIIRMEMNFKAIY
ncbi:MAG: hypothetical protein PHC84_01280 [Clostridia bacterium]|nr:hypothetical protein [Clostridia bacterium]